MHDPRLGRFFAVDPLAPKYPHNSPYAFSENRLLDGVELEGLEVAAVMHSNVGSLGISFMAGGGSVWSADEGWYPFVTKGIGIQTSASVFSGFEFQYFPEMKSVSEFDGDAISVSVGTPYIGAEIIECNGYTGYSFSFGESASWPPYSIGVMPTTTSLTPMDGTTFTDIHIKYQKRVIEGLKQIKGKSENKINDLLVESSVIRETDRYYDSLIQKLFKLEDTGPLKSLLVAKTNNLKQLNKIDENISKLNKMINDFNKMIDEIEIKLTLEKLTRKSEEPSNNDNNNTE